MTVVAIALLGVSCLLIVMVPRHPAQRLAQPRSIAVPVRLSRRRADTSDAVAVFAAFAAEIRTGGAPSDALRLALDPFPTLCPRTTRALDRNVGVADALRADAAATKNRSWAALAAVWDLADQYGVSLAAVAEQLAAHGRDVAAARRTIDAELAESRATVRVLAGLPVIGIALGMLLGAHPLSWLLDSSVGPVVLVLAALLEVAGLLWVRVLVRSVERQL